MSDTEITLEGHLVGPDSYLAVPIIEPKQIEDEDTRKVVIALADRSGAYLAPVVSSYALPELPEERDPRSLMRKTFDALQLRISPRKAEVQRRIEAGKTIAKAQAQGEWLEEAVGGIQEQMEQLCKAYEGIAGYTADVSSGLEQLEEKIQERSTYIASAPIYAKKLQDALKDTEWRSARREEMGKDGAQQSSKIIAEELNATRKSIAHTQQLLSYLEIMQRHYTGVLASSKESLTDIQMAVTVAQKQSLDLAQTLHTYQGLTQHQIAGTQAIQFLRDVARVTDGLKASMNEVHGLLHGEARKYELCAPKLEAAPFNLIERIERLSGAYASARRELEAHPQYRQLQEMTQTELPADLAQMIQQYETARKGLEEERIIIPSIVKLKEDMPTRVRDENYENIEGNLRDAYKNTVSGTMLHVAEITKARITDNSLRMVGFYTADGPLYFLKGGKPMLALTREKDNLVLKHIDEAFEQLVHGGGNYYPDAEEARKAITASETTVIDISQLRLENDNNEWSHLAINTGDYSGLNAEEKKL
ncbi:hypothetical protein HYX13_04240, partial [Candidatus Woesearchaeota archaeon]|nr:hypothetical protein [Candidatus Woesearchaeota archaeon]